MDAFEQWLEEKLIAFQKEMDLAKTNIQHALWEDQFLTAQSALYAYREWKAEYAGKSEVVDLR